VIADVVVRLATLVDATDIALMSRDCIEHGLPWSWRESRVAHSIRDPETNVAVVGEAHAITAFGIMNYQDDEAHLLLFAVHRAWRRKGVGSAVLRWLEEVARVAGVSRVLVDARVSNAAGRNFYAEHGYHERVITKGRYCGVEDGVRLEKWLRVNEAAGE
jgi:ribosomal protein S18 acetylase RimI-like enzyme